MVDTLASSFPYFGNYIRPAENTFIGTSDENGFDANDTAVANTVVESTCYFPRKRKNTIQFFMMINVDAQL